MPASYGDSQHPLQMYPLVRELAVNWIAIVVRCQVLKIACQPYTAGVKDPMTCGDRGGLLSRCELRCPPRRPGARLPLAFESWSRPGTPREPFQTFAEILPCVSGAPDEESSRKSAAGGRTEESEDYPPRL